MCGIWCCLSKNECPDPSQLLHKLIARGPEGTRIKKINSHVTFGFTRLAINGLSESGMQPFTKNGITWMCNGEIYNAKQLETDLGLTNTGSDCECIGELYLRHRDDLKTFARCLDGVFAIAVFDSERNQLIVTRDPYGVRPMFISKNYSHITFASEMKALSNISASKVSPVKPGTLEVYNLGTIELLNTIQYHTIPWVRNPTFSNVKDASMAIRSALEKSVEKRLLTERPIAALLSGGLDSSLIASLLQRMLTERQLPPLKTFSIGFQGSSDLAHARIVADWIKSDHTEITMTPDEFFNAIPEVIEAIESYDTTTVRASTGNYLIAKKIRELTDCKVVFNGDGSDELFGGYLYFNNAPGDQEFHSETERLLENIHTFDVLRSDRSISANGLEARTPFLDKQFVALVRSIDPSMLRPIRGHCDHEGRIEKYILRHAFDDGVTLPAQVLWRRKEAFSDGVSSPEKAWFQEIQDRVKAKVPSDWLSDETFSSHLCPKTPEEYYYRSLFTSIFSRSVEKTTVPYRWMPKWSPETNDPSARTLRVYNA
jgi:asparagine synthase (glutamine-hydrolysing)